MQESVGWGQTRDLFSPCQRQANQSLHPSPCKLWCMMGSNVHFIQPMRAIDGICSVAEARFWSFGDLYRITWKTDRTRATVRWFDSDVVYLSLAPCWSWNNSMIAAVIQQNPSSDHCTSKIIYTQNSEALRTRSLFYPRPHVFLTMQIKPFIQLSRLQNGIWLFNFSFWPCGM